MLSLQLHPDQIELLAEELARAGRREIGGVLVGEQLAPNTFRLIDVSVQRSGGTLSCFVCEPSVHQPFLDEFFARTGNDFSRFNYLGEWHSHPLFSVAPSLTDLRQLQALADDEAVPRPFVILVIARLARRNRLEASALVFRPNLPPTAADVTVAPRPDGEKPTGQRSWWKRILGSTSHPQLVVTKLNVTEAFGAHSG